ncbi:MAG: hypothetical protein HYW22_02155 [Candidatus Aenigmarchaeota archaeon]|nr:hypothetical protein [Candidatus Aenigmarchaeota archaeon]
MTSAIQSSSRETGRSIAHGHLILGIGPVNGAMSAYVVAVITRPGPRTFTYELPRLGYIHAYEIVDGLNQALSPEGLSLSEGSERAIREELLPLLYRRDEVSGVWHRRK